MKVTQLKEMIYSPSGELEELKYTQSMKRIVPSSEIASKPCIQNQNRMAIANCAYVPPQDKEDLKSVVSYMSKQSSATYKSAKSGISCKYLGDKRSVFSKSSGASIGHYDLQNEVSLNWKLYMILIVLALGVYVFWPADSFAAHQYQKIEAKQEEAEFMNETMAIQNNARTLVGLYLDQLMAVDTHKMSLREFRKKMFLNSSNPGGQDTWREFQSLLETNPSIKISMQEEDRIGQLI